MHDPNQATRRRLAAHALLLAVSDEFLALVSENFTARVALVHLAGDKTPDARRHPVGRLHVDAAANRSVAPATSFHAERVESTRGHRNRLARNHFESELVIR